MIDLKDIDTFKVIDDFIPKENQELVETMFTSGPLPWYIRNSVYDNNKDNALVHCFIWDGHQHSESLDYLNDIFISNTNIENGILRLRSVLTYNGEITTPHIDIPDREHFNCVYYVNDSDGDTILYEDDGETEMVRVKPKKGRIVFFRGDILHSAGIPQKSDYRIVVNLNILSNSCLLYTSPSPRD